MTGPYISVFMCSDSRRENEMLASSAGVSSALCSWIKRSEWARMVAGDKGRRFWADRNASMTGRARRFRKVHPSLRSFRKVHTGFECRPADNTDTLEREHFGPKQWDWHKFCAFHGVYYLKSKEVEMDEACSLQVGEECSKYFGQETCK
jgi:hypothetical protein